MTPTRRKHKPHWYYIEIHECPLCGRGATYRERRYSRKPRDASKRYGYFQDSACPEHFF